jgi:methylmalonyl-CoA mutase
VGGVERLIGRTADGIPIYPLYGQGEGARADRTTQGPWTVVQRVDHPTEARANAQALEDLAGGANGLALSISPGNLPAALKGVMLHAVAIRLEGGDELARSFAKFAGKQPVDPARLDVSFGAADAALMNELKAQGFTGPFSEADGRKLHEKGATEAQELGGVLFALVTSLRNQQSAGVTLAANQDMFMTLAKFRALRLLWTRVLEASGIEFSALRIHAETSRRMMATLDPHMNILRATAAVFGAGLGGADSICVLPFSLAQGLPDAHARRIARNTQLVLLEESNLWRVADTGSGSGYVESLTHELCEKAWKIFQGIEATGQLPTFDSSSAASAPVIGVTTHRLAHEFAAAVEALS